jgi:hypothetical protein
MAVSIKENNWFFVTDQTPRPIKLLANQTPRQPLVILNSRVFDPQGNLLKGARCRLHAHAAPRHP